VITHIDGKPVSSREELRAIVNKYRPGTTARFTIYRGQAKMEMDVLLAEQPATRGWRF